MNNYITITVIVEAALLPVIGQPVTLILEVDINESILEVKWRIGDALPSLRNPPERRDPFVWLAVYDRTKALGYRNLREATTLSYNGITSGATIYCQKPNVWVE